MRNSEVYDHPNSRALMRDLDAAQESGDSPLWELIYFSTCSMDVPADVLEEIRADASARNEARGITGLLVHKDGSLVQVLEGPKREIADTFKRFILPSRKHWSVMPVVSEPISKRSFKKWWLACGDLTNEKTLPLSTVRHEVLSNPAASRTVRSFLSAFVA